MIDKTKIDQVKLEAKLRDVLRREPTQDEKLNAITDMNLVLSVLVDEIDELKKKVK